MCWFLFCPSQLLDPFSAPLCPVLCLRNLRTASPSLLCHLACSWGWPVGDTSRRSEWWEREAREFLPCSFCALSLLWHPVSDSICNPQNYLFYWEAPPPWLQLPPGLSNTISFPRPFSPRVATASHSYWFQSALPPQFVPLTLPLLQGVVPSIEFS